MADWLLSGYDARPKAWGASILLELPIDLATKGDSGEREQRLLERFIQPIDELDNSAQSRPVAPPCRACR
jgi:hypothetical protein